MTTHDAKGRFIKGLRRPLIERFLEKVQVTDSCWIWQGSVTDSSEGYGHIRDEQSIRCRAHVVAYELFVGPIAPGLEIDHLCHNADHECRGGRLCLHRRCVNPEHLEPVLPRTNRLRSLVNPLAKLARRTHCPKGHLFDETNTIRRTSDGHGRRCRICEREKERRHRIYIRAWQQRRRDYLREQRRQRTGYYLRHPEQLPVPEV